MEKGRIHIICGDGKGKTTAAIGQIIRALGADYQVYFVQFMKHDDSSELKVLNILDNVKVINLKNKYKFSFLLTNEEKLEMTKEQNSILNKLKLELSNLNKKTILVLDEVNSAIELELLDYKLLIDFITNKSDYLEIVLTGRNPKIELLNLADYISKLEQVKHPYTTGLNARKGIEY